MLTLNTIALLALIITLTFTMVISIGYVIQKYAQNHKLLKVSMVKINTGATLSVLYKHALFNTVAFSITPFKDNKVYCREFEYYGTRKDLIIYVLSEDGSEELITVHLRNIKKATVIPGEDIDTPDSNIENPIEESEGRIQ